MIAESLCPAITSDRIDECRDFYVRFLGARVAFDCGWYIHLQFGSPAANVAFMSPRGGQSQPLNPAGLTLNFQVQDVDAEHSRLTDLGLRGLTAPEDHPWGDRSFSLHDPNGIELCLYMEIEPSAEFKEFYR